MGNAVECFMCGGRPDDVGPLTPFADDALICRVCQEEKGQRDRRIEEAKRTTPCTVCGRLLEPDEPCRVEYSGDNPPVVWCSEHTEQLSREIEVRLEEWRQRFWHPQSTDGQEWEYLYLKQSCNDGGTDFRVHDIEPRNLSPAHVVPGMPFDAGWNALLRAGWKPDQFALGVPRDGDDNPGNGAFRFRRRAQPG